MRIVFFGTPEFAVASLHALLHGPLHRGRRGHPARQAAGPVPLRAGSSAGQGRGPGGRASRCSSRCARWATSSCQLCGAWSPTSAWWSRTGTSSGPKCSSLPARGMINVHASLLPRFRGAAPIQHAILAGDRETGISIMQMEEGLDSGPVLHRVATPIGADETAGSLADAAGRTRRRRAGGGAVAALRRDRPVPAAGPQPRDLRSQDSTGSRPARLGRDRPRSVRQIRAFDPVPGRLDRRWTASTLKLFGAQAGGREREPRNRARSCRTGW